MGKNHLSRMAAPRTWDIPRKETKWITRPLAGAQKLEHSLPLNLVLRDFLSVGDTAKEIRRILNEGLVHVNKKVRKEPKYAVGLFSLIEIPKLKKAVVLMFNQRGKLALYDVKDKKQVLLRVKGRTAVKGGKLQVNCHDGRSILSKEKCKSGDSLVFDLEAKKIVEVVSLEKKKKAYLLGGKHIGELVTIVDVPKHESFGRPKVVVKHGDKEFTTLKDYVFVVGDKNPLGAKK